MAANLTEATAEQTQAALKRYGVHRGGRDHPVPWLASMHSRTRERYALRLAAIEDEVEAGELSETERSLAIAILRAERDAELAAKRIEMEGRKSIAKWREAHEYATAANARHAGLLQLWFGDGRGSLQGPVPHKIEQRANGRAARALRRAAVETLTGEQRQAVPTQGAIKEGADPLGGPAGEDLL